MSYRLAKALTALKDAINASAPNRNRISDGWIGDASHASRSSDHNPWVKDGKQGIVTALDITHDPAHGVDGDVLAAALITDPRVKYVIWNKKIWSESKPTWRKYTGSNPHTKHVHVSASSKKEDYDDDKEPWVLGVEEAAKVAADLPPAAPEHEKLQIKDQGGDVFLLQSLLGNLKVDGDFGPKTQKTVKAFQAKHKLKPDGIVGPYTWDALLKAAGPVKAEAIALALTAPPAPATPARAVTNEINPVQAVTKLQSLGWSRRDAVAIISNFMWESGGHSQGKINWLAKGDRGNSKGGGQWNKGAGRWQQLDEFAAKRGTDWTDSETQLEFANEELNTTYRKAAKKIRDAGSLEEAVRTAAIEYWRPGKPHLDKRVSVAEKLDKEVPV